MKYFLYNKKSDYQRGCMENCIYENGVLTVEDAGREQGGVLISRLMDSREKETVWHRFSMDCTCTGDASVQFSVYASEVRELFFEGRRMDLEEFLREKEIPVWEKKEKLRKFLVKELLNPSDVLLHEARGRYLWFMAELFPRGQESPRIGVIQVFFPKTSWADRLPAVYREQSGDNSFLERYLGIFQSIYEETEKQIRLFDRLLDPRTAPSEVLMWLAGWLDVEHIHMWREDRLRRFLEQAAKLYRLRGTRKGLLLLAELYTGKPAFLMEYQELVPYLADVEQRRKLERLYGSDKSVCFLLMKEDALPTYEEYQAMEYMIEDARPAQVRIRLLVLKDFLILGGHSYLGINSRLARLRPMVLDGASLLPFTALKKEDTR